MKLDEWIKNHREDFDQVDAPDQLWSDISKAVPQQRKPAPYWLYAAAAALLLAMGLGLYKFQNPTSSHLNGHLPQAFLAQEQSYQRDVQAVKQQLDLSTLSENPDYQWVFEELAHLDRINQQYRRDAEYLVPQEELMAVLIDNYEKRLRLLRRLQMELERNQRHHENENINL